MDLKKQLHNSLSFSGQLLSDPDVALFRAKRKARKILGGFLDEAAATVVGAPILPERKVPVDVLRTRPITDLIYSRLTPEDLQDIERVATEEERKVMAGADPIDKKWVTLAAGVFHQLPKVLEHTRLLSAMPPDHVHAMSRSWMGAGGSYGHVDQLVDALGQVGVELKDGMAGLDFGCSSGRVSRILEAANPKLVLKACDPNDEAIAWASANLRGVEFKVSPQSPPLPYATGEFDFVYAVSIWSHFGEKLGLRWFDEMHRILKPGAHLVFTTHGLRSIAYYNGTHERPFEQLVEINHALAVNDFWYKGEFGETGDYGVVNEEWGTAFFTPEWLARNLLPKWSLRLFATGREGANQDLYVLQRV